MIISDSGLLSARCSGKRVRKQLTSVVHIYVCITKPVWLCILYLEHNCLVSVIKINVGQIYVIYCPI